MEQPHQVIQPGPVDGSLLYLQEQHISQAVWDNNVDRILNTRRFMQLGEPPIQIIKYLRQAGFYGVSRLGQFEYDRSLISALIERWRPETHTFHTTRGKCIITLEDVAIQLGLPCAGLPVIGQTTNNWPEVCECYLGIRPPSENIYGQRLFLNWLEEHFSQLDDNASNMEKRYFARAYILKLIGGYLMPDRSGHRVYLMYLPLLANFKEAGKYRWGSAVLAHLYREMCNATNPSEVNIGGCLALLHLWAWDRFPVLAPERPPSLSPNNDVYPLLPPLGFRWRNIRLAPRSNRSALRRYRSLLDAMADDEIIWQPYESPRNLGLIPDYCLETSDIWRASVPLICFHIIEWHHSDRVLRQFGFQQPIPMPPTNLDDFHTTQLRGKTSENWIEAHKIFLEVWFNWPYAIIDAPQANEVFHRTSEYMQWYWRRTRRWIHPTSSATGYVADIAEDLYRLAITYPPEMSTDFHTRVAQDQRNILIAMREQRFNMELEPAPPAQEPPHPQIPQRRRPSKRRDGYLSTRPPIASQEENTMQRDHATTSATSSTFVGAASSSFMPPSSLPSFSSHIPCQSGSFMSLLGDSTLFNAEYNMSSFQHGEPSNQTFETPRQSISLADSTWFDLNTAQTPSRIDLPESHHTEEDMQPERPRRNRRRARCGTGSHYV